jgi:two-component system NtrC family sensor kinase
MSARNLPSLRWRIVAALLLVSLVPLIVVSGGAWIVFGRIIEARSLQTQRATVQSHALAIDRFLGERLRALDLAARHNPVQALQNPESLRRLLATLNGSYDNAFVDLGVVGSDGAHLAYVGPYALGDKNYAQEPWFAWVLKEGTHVSDVFLGFRQVPHCIVAIRRVEGSKTWILRATINSRQFEQLVRTGRFGETGDAFIVNERGQYQTPSRLGKAMEMSSIASPRRHEGVRESRVALRHGVVSRTTTWLNGGRWMLVVQQSEAEILAPLHRALTRGALVVLVGVVLIVGTTLLATRSLVSRIARARRRQESLYNDLIRSARLASVGEMATGLAHEINNPLAILSAEHTNLEDLLGDIEVESKALQEARDVIPRCQRQVERCARITSKMLQFGRHSESDPRWTDLQPRLAEIVELMSKRAQVQNVELQLEVEPSLPRVLLDHTELEQVVVNIVNNALYATKGGGRIAISARTHGNEVRLTVTDDGEGIPPAVLERIFLPFYTTKPVGQGTGLGLSVCYGIVRSWGGSIEVESELGQGARVTVRIPVGEGVELTDSVRRKRHARQA